MHAAAKAASGDMVMAWTVLTGEICILIGRYKQEEGRASPSTEGAEETPPYIG